MLFKNASFATVAQRAAIEPLGGLGGPGGSRSCYLSYATAQRSNTKHNVAGRKAVHPLSKISVAKMTSFLRRPNTVLLGFNDLIFLFLFLALSHVRPSRTHLVACVQASIAVRSTKGVRHFPGDSACFVAGLKYFCF